MFGIDMPIVVFSHCRDAVVLAANAGGSGVFGADTVDADPILTTCAD
jgi:hypothetical protein